MVSPSANEVFIQGRTRSGKPFRPSDWAERLSGVMSPFHPAGRMPGAPGIRPAGWKGLITPDKRSAQSLGRKGLPLRVRP